MLLEVDALKKIDSSEMCKAYDQWPQSARNAFNSDLEPFAEIGVDHIVFAGMGGSGTIGSIFSSILSKFPIHVTVVKGYLLPKTVNSNTLVVTTSISGNTIETLTTLETALKMNSKIIAFSSGGKMEKYCKKHNIEFRNIFQTHSPRASLPNFLYSMLQVLESVIPISKDDVNESLGVLDEVSEKISSHNLTEKNLSLELAKWIKGIPMIYYPAGLKAAAVRFKNSLNENAKLHAMTEDVIESCHNGIVSWEQKSNIVPILIRGEDDYIKTKERWDILTEYFIQKEIDFKNIHSGRGSILTKLIKLVYELDYASIYKAILSRIDPSPIGPIDFVKQRL